MCQCIWGLVNSSPTALIPLPPPPPSLTRICGEGSSTWWQLGRPSFTCRAVSIPNSIIYSYIWFDSFSFYFETVLYIYIYFCCCCCCRIVPVPRFMIINLLQYNLCSPNRLIYIILIGRRWLSGCLFKWGVRHHRCVEQLMWFNDRLIKDDLIHSQKEKSRGVWIHPITTPLPPTPHTHIDMNINDRFSTGWLAGPVISALWKRSD